MFPYIGNVVVDASYRRKGIALSLMNQALQSTKEWGVAYAFCAVHTENEAASDLYLNKLGFRIFRFEKNDKNFFSMDKRSRYILVKEFPSIKNSDSVHENNVNEILSMREIKNQEKGFVEKIESKRESSTSIDTPP